MIIKTKKHRLSPRTYIRIGFGDTMRRQWWVTLLAIIATSSAFYIGYFWSSVTLLTLYFLYLVFWFVQFYGVTVMEESKAFFAPITYQISSKEIVMMLTKNRGSQIDWKQIQYMRKGSKGVVLFIDRGQFIHLPNRVFMDKQERLFFSQLLERKKIATRRF